MLSNPLMTQQARIKGHHACGRVRIMGREWNTDYDNLSEEEYLTEYHRKLREERERKREIRRQKEQHRRVIVRCNILILCESVTLVFLIIALILQYR